jgi:hypothetical protein
LFGEKFLFGLELVKQVVVLVIDRYLYSSIELGQQMAKLGLHGGLLGLAGLDLVGGGDNHGYSWGI